MIVICCIHYPLMVVGWNQKAQAAAKKQANTRIKELETELSLLTIQLEQAGEAARKAASQDASAQMKDLLAKLAALEEQLEIVSAKLSVSVDAKQTVDCR